MTTQRQPTQGQPTQGQPAQEQPSSGVRRGEARQRTDEKIAAAVRQIMRTAGPDAVTMEAVSALSGVAKTTLYRRYTDRYDLMVRIAEQFPKPRMPIPEVVTEESFTTLVSTIRDTVAREVGYASVGRLLASDETFLSTWRDRLIRPRIGALHDFFRRGVSEGTLREDVDYQQVIEFIFGGAVMGDAVRGGLPDDWATLAAATLWRSIAAR